MSLVSKLFRKKQCQQSPQSPPQFRSHLLAHFNEASSLYEKQFNDTIASHNINLHTCYIIKQKRKMHETLSADEISADNTAKQCQLVMNERYRTLMDIYNRMNDEERKQTTKARELFFETEYDNTLNTFIQHRSKFERKDYVNRQASYNELKRVHAKLSHTDQNIHYLPDEYCPLEPRYTRAQMSDWPVSVDSSTWLRAV